ncbi:MAG: TadE/TadG family type IV pilus assembly protein [Pseudomonadota bacterium]
MYKKFLFDRRGNFAALFTIVAFPLLAGIGMAMEYSNITSQRSKLQNAVDAAILFAGRYLEENGELPSVDDVKGFVQSNFDGSFVIGEFKKSDDDLYLSVNAKVPPFFFGEIYPEVFDQNVSASVPYGGDSYLELVMVLDNTGSMYWGKDRCIEGRCQRLC